MKTHYRAPWSTKLKLMTGAVLLLFVIVLIFSGSAGGAIVIGSVLICALFAIRGYRIEDGKLKIQRLGWSKDYSLRDLTKAEFDPAATAGSIRTFGIGGLFGFIGYFHNSLLGDYRAYATDTSDTVVLDFDGKKVVITPEQPAEFVKAIKSYTE